MRLQLGRAQPFTDIHIKTYEKKILAILQAKVCIHTTESRNNEKHAIKLPATSAAQAG